MAIEGVAIEGVINKAKGRGRLKENRHYTSIFI